MSKLSYQIPEAVVATGLSRSTIYEEIQTGRLKAFKVGGRRRIFTEELQSFLTRCAHEGMHAANQAQPAK